MVNDETRNECFGLESLNQLIFSRRKIQKAIRSDQHRSSEDQYSIYTYTSSTSKQDSNQPQVPVSTTQILL